MRRWLLVFGAAAGLALSIGAAACGSDGDDALTLEEFFQELEALDDSFDENVDSLEADFDENIAGVTDPQEAFDTGVQFFTDLSTELNAFVEGIESLDAPEEAQQLQEDAVKAGKDAVAAVDEIAAAAGDAETEEEFSAAVESPALEEAFNAFSAVCLDAQTMADENDIDVDLNCEDEE